MTLKKPNNLKAFDETTVYAHNQNIDTLYGSKLESRWKREDAGVSSFIYQSQECGEVTFSATGSPTISKSFGFKEKQDTIVFAQAHAKSTLVTAHVTDVTASGITIECRTVSGTGNFSSVTTAVVSVFYSVIGSNP